MMALLRRVRSADVKVSGYHYRVQLRKRGRRRPLGLRSSGVQITRRGSRRPLGLRSTLVMVTLALAGLAQPQPEAAGRVVAFNLPDGRMISALWMEAPSRPAAAVVLVPMLGRSR